MEIDLDEVWDRVEPEEEDEIILDYFSLKEDLKELFRIERQKTHEFLTKCRETLKKIKNNTIVETRYSSNYVVMPKETYEELLSLMQEVINFLEKKAGLDSEETKTKEKP